MNKISFTGRIGSDGELRYTSDGKAILNFRVASDVGYGERKSTNWFSCSLFDKRAVSFEKFAQKGQEVTVFGTLTLREWTNKDGIKQLSPDVAVDDVQLQGGKRQLEQKYESNDDDSYVPF